MRPLVLIGLILVVLGVVALAIPSFTFFTTEHVADAGFFKIDISRPHTLVINPIVGGVALAAGIVLLIGGVVPLPPDRLAASMGCEVDADGAGVCLRSANQAGQDRWCQRTLFPRKYVMNWDQIAGDWKQFKGKVKEKWGNLTDDDLTTIAGKRDQLAGLLQQRYGYEKQRAEKELDEFSAALKS